MGDFQKYFDHSCFVPSHSPKIIMVPLNLLPKLCGIILHNLMYTRSTPGPSIAAAISESGRHLGVTCPRCSALLLPGLNNFLGKRRAKQLLCQIDSCFSSSKSLSVNFFLGTRLPKR